MPLVRYEPKQLKAEIVKTVWPADTAVDYKASDLKTWCRVGGSSGIVLNPGEKPAYIRIKPLGDRAYNRVLGLIHRQSSVAFEEAFRFGCLSIDGIPMSRQSIDGIEGITEDMLDMLGDKYRIELPYFYAIDALNKEFSEEKTTPSDDFMLSSMTNVLGVHILRMSFRSRKNSV